MAVRDDLLMESDGLRQELHTFRCLTQIKAEERSQKHRELLRAQVHHITHSHTVKPDMHCATFLG